jgi:hypothetical protein
MLSSEFAAYPRVGRYAMQPGNHRLLFAKAGGFPGDTSYKFTK